MTRKHLTAALAVVAAGLLAACADSALAQGGPGGFGRGFGRFGRTVHQVQLATLPEVQEELKLSDEQQQDISDLNADFDDERRNLGFGGGGGGGGGFSEEARAARAKLNAEFATELNEVLDEAQKKRLQEIYVQVNGAAALTDADVAAALELSDKQKEDLAAAQAEQREAMQDAFQDFQDMSDDERTAKIEELTKARDEALLAVLTADQKAKLETLKGEHLDIDVTPLRGGPGGRGGA